MSKISKSGNGDVKESMTAIGKTIKNGSDAVKKSIGRQKRKVKIAPDPFRSEMTKIQNDLKIGSAVIKNRLSDAKDSSKEHYEERNVKKLSVVIAERKKSFLKKLKNRKKEVPQYVRAEKTLSNSVKGGLANSVTTGLTTNYLTPFAIANGAGSSVIAAIGAFPDFIGALFQLLSIKLIELFKSRKKLVLAAILVQTILWIPLMLIPYIARGNFFLLILLITMNSALTTFQNPIMDSLMGDVIPADQRGRFYGKRNRFISLVSFVCSFGAGLLLNYYQDRNIFFGFIILFSGAAVAKLASFYYKAKLYDTPSKTREEAKFSLKDFIRKMKETNFGRFVLFTFFFRIAVSIAGPFFTLYMLRDLKLSYLIFTIISVASIISTFLSMSFWGNVTDSKGSRFTLLVSGIMIPLVPLLWLFNHNWIYLLIVESFSGFCWAGFSLGVSSFMFDATSPEKRVRCISYYTLFWGAGIFIGSLIGGWMINANISLLMFSSIPLVFLISGILRLAAVLYFLPIVREARLIELPLGKKHTYFQTRLTIRHREGFQLFSDSSGITIDDTAKMPEKKTAKEKQTSGKSGKR